MKIWFDRNYNILKSDNNNIFGKGNNLNDRVEVLLSNAAAAHDNMLPTFKFRLASNRTLGAYTHNETPYQTEDGYTAFPFVLNDTILSVKGDLEITIEFQFFSESLKLIRTKNVSAKAIVTDNIVLNDEIYIVGNEGEIVEAVRENMDALNARQTALETTLVNNETIDVDRVNGIIYGKQFYPMDADGTLGDGVNRFAKAYINAIVSPDNVEHPTKDILDTRNISYENGDEIYPTAANVGTFTFGNVTFNLYSPTHLITADNQTIGKYYLVGVSQQNVKSDVASHSNVYMENGVLNAKTFKAESFEPKENTFAKVGTVSNPFEEVNANFVKAEYFNYKPTANKSLVEDTEITKLKGLPSQESLNRTIEDLQSQIDGINAGQNLADIVGTYADLASYNKTNLKANDKIQVLADEEHEGDSSVYNWNGASFVYVGSYGQNAYTKAEVDRMHDELDERMNQHESNVEAQMVAFKGEVNTKIDQNNESVANYKVEIFNYVDKAIGNIPALLDELIGTSEEV